MSDKQLIDLSSRILNSMTIIKGLIQIQIEQKQDKYYSVILKEIDNMTREVNVAVSKMSSKEKF